MKLLEILPGNFLPAFIKNNNTKYHLVMSPEMPVLKIINRSKDFEEPFL